MNMLLELSIIVTTFLVSLIIITQIVSYPLFLKVNQNNFSEYHNSYTLSISKIVLPLMLAELSLSLALFLSKNDFNTIIALIINISIWISTFLIQVPIHNKISFQYSEVLIKKLIRSNWVRTFLWCAKLITLLNMKEVV